MIEAKQQTVDYSALVPEHLSRQVVFDAKVIISYLRNDSSWHTVDCGKWVSTHPVAIAKFIAR